MRLLLLGLAFFLVTSGAPPCFGQQRTEPTAAGNQPDADVDGTTGQPKAALPSTPPSATDHRVSRPQGTLIRPRKGAQYPELAQAWGAYDAAIDKATESLTAAIAKQFDAATAKGNFDAAYKWQTAREKFEKFGVLPAETELKAAVSSTVMEYNKAMDELMRAYESVVESLTKEKKIAEAKAVRTERQLITPNAAITGQKDRAVSRRAPSSHRIDAGKSWQPTITVVAGETYIISAKGRWTSNVKTNSWQGPEFVGNNGLRARIGEGAAINVGKGISLKPTQTGVLYFELFGNAKQNDRGFVEVQIE